MIPIAVSPMLISRITDSKGRVLNESKPAPLDESARTLDARNAFVMTSLLQEVTRSGTAARAQALLKRPDILAAERVDDGRNLLILGLLRHIVGNQIEHAAHVDIGRGDPFQQGCDIGAVAAIAVQGDVARPRRVGDQRAPRAPVGGIEPGQQPGGRLRTIAAKSPPVSAKDAARRRAARAAHLALSPNPTERPFHALAVHFTALDRDR